VSGQITACGRSNLLQPDGRKSMVNRLAETGDLLENCTKLSDAGISGYGCTRTDDATFFPTNRILIRLQYQFLKGD
jgi:hypothetical protein